jgi:MarR family transcriptional regulator, transcriptional regulator for hemolysin
MKSKKQAIHLQKEPGWDPEAAPTFWINHASRLVMRHFEQCLRPLGFGFAYLPVAMALSEDGPCQQKDLARRAHVEQATMAALLARMERDGLIERSPHPTDKRASLISLTAKARARLPEVKALLQRGADQAAGGFSDAERATFIGMLQRVVANLDAREDDEET